MSTQMLPLRPNTQRAKTAIILIWVVMGLQIVSLYSSYLQDQLLSESGDGAFISEEVATANDTRESIIGFVVLAAYVTSMITFIQWFRRAYYNLHLRVKTLRHSEGWAAGAWFVPIVGLFWPYQIMMDLYKQTTAYLKRKGVPIEKEPRTELVGGWWTFWVISAVLGQVSFRLSMHAETIDALADSTVADMLSCILDIPLAILAVAVIKGYARLEPLLASVKDEEQSPVLDPAIAPIIS